MSYRGVNIPEELMQEVERIIHTKKHGFKSKAEFIKQAIREKVDKFPK